MLKRKVKTMIDKFNKDNHTAVLREMFNLADEFKSEQGGIIFRSYDYVGNPDYSMNIDVEHLLDGSCDVCMEVWYNHPEYGVTTIWREIERHVEPENLYNIATRMQVCAVGVINTFIW